MYTPTNFCHVKRSAGSMADTARTPSPAARPAPGRETGNSGAPGTRCLPPAATASGLQLLQSATSSGLGTDTSTLGSGSVPSQELASSRGPGAFPPAVAHGQVLAHPHAGRHLRLHQRVPAFLHRLWQPLRLEASPRRSRQSSDIMLRLQDDPAPIPRTKI